MTNNKNIVLSLKLHDDRLEPDYDIAVRFPTTIAIVELVFVARCVVFWVAFLDFSFFRRKRERRSKKKAYRNLLICHPVTDTSVKLVKRFPCEFRVFELSCGFDRPL